MKYLLFNLKKTISIIFKQPLQELTEGLKSIEIEINLYFIVNYFIIRSVMKQHWLQECFLVIYRFNIFYRKKQEYTYKKQLITNNNITI